MSARRMSVADCWELSASHARLHAGVMRGSVDVARPDLGLTALGLAETSVPGCLLGVTVEVEGENRAASAWTPSDAYVRGRDLVVSYREPLGQPFNLQVYWRVVTVEADLALDAIISIQTPSWEAYPCVTAGSTLPSAAVHAARQALIYPMEAHGDYVEVTRPGDFALAPAEPCHDGLNSRRWRFERQFMERGVIRRLHLRGGFTSGQGEAMATRLRKSLTLEQPPLTA